MKRNGMAGLDSAEGFAGVLGRLHDQGVSWLLLLPAGYEGDHAELATSSSGRMAAALADPVLGPIRSEGFAAVMPSQGGC